MAEHIVEHVGFLDIVKALAAADEISGGKAPVGQVPEEHMIGDQHWHWHHAPSGQCGQLGADPGKFGDPAGTQIEPFKPAHKGTGGAPGQDLLLPREQRIPDRIFLAAVAVLRRFEPIFAQSGRTHQRRGEHPVAHIGQPGKVGLGGGSRVSHGFRCNYIIAGQSLQSWPL